MPKRPQQTPTLFTVVEQPTAVRRVPVAGQTDILAHNFFDAAYPSPENIRNWGHLQPETIEDIFDPDTLQKLQIASICEVLNDDALNGMVAVGAESIIGRGCQVRVQCGLRHNKFNELEQYIEYLWDSWFKSVRYAHILRTAQKDQMVLGSYYRRIVQNPHRKFGIDIMLVSPLRIQTPYNMQEGDFIMLDGEYCRVYNGIAFDEYRNRRFYCISERPLFANGYYDNATYEWVSAKHMCHVFDPQFSEQITGYPMIASSLEKGVMRRQYEKEELKAARLGAALTGTFETSSDFRAIFETLLPQDRDTIVKQLFDNWSRAGESIPIGIEDFLNMPPTPPTAAPPTNIQASATPMEMPPVVPPSPAVHSTPPAPPNHRDVIHKMYERGDISVDIIAQADDQNWTPYQALQAQNKINAVNIGVDGNPNVAGFPDVSARAYLLLLWAL